MSPAAPGARCQDCGAELPMDGAAEGLCLRCRRRLGKAPLEPNESAGDEAATQDAAGRASLGGRYQLRGLLGRGGMGEVWRASDLKLGLDVALKAARPEHAPTQRTQEILRQEVRSARAVVSPNVCRIFDLVVEEGREFVSMEFVDGTTLSDTLRTRGPLLLPEAWDVASQFLAGLEAIHQAGLVHRDFKPENVMLTRAGRVVVMDFGLAKADTAGGTWSTSGTPAYMAPEQARGEAVDARADVFSAGLVLAEMLDVGGEGAMEARQALWRAARETPPRVPDSPWAPVLRQALAPAPAHRHASARALALALEDVTLRVPGLELRERLPKTPVAAAPRFRVTFPGSRRGRLGLLGAVLAFVLAPGLWSSLRVRPASPASSRKMIAVLPFDNVGRAEEAYFAAGVTEEITSRLSLVRSIGLIARKSALQYEGTTKSTREIGKELGVDFILDGTVRWSAGGAAAARVRITLELSRVADATGLWVKTYDRVVEDIFQIQTEIAEDVIAQLGVVLLGPERSTLEARPTGDLDAYQAYLRGRYLAQSDYSIEGQARVIEQFQKSVNLDPAFVPGYIELSRAHSFFYYLGHDLSDERRELAKAAAERAYALAPEAPEVHVALGFYYYWVRGDYRLAMKEFEIAEAGLPSNPEILEAKALVFRRQGSWEEALAHFRRALQFNPRDASLIGGLAETYANTRDYDEAVRYYDRAIALAPGEAGLFIGKAWTYWIWRGSAPEARATLERLPPTRDTQAVWAWFWQEVFERRYDAALERLGAADAKWIGFPESYSPKPLLAAHAYRFSGQTERARQAYEEASKLLEAEVQRWPVDPRRHAALGIAYAALGRSDEAVREGRSAIELHPISADAFSGAYYVSELAFIYTLLGESASAIDLVEGLLGVPSLLSVPMLKLDPRWDPLRSEPRFREMLQKYAGDELLEGAHKKDLSH